MATVARTVYREVCAEVDVRIPDAPTREAIKLAYFDRLVRSDMGNAIRPAIERRDPATGQLFDAIAAFLEVVPRLDPRRVRRPDPRPGALARPELGDAGPVGQAGLLADGAGRPAGRSNDGSADRDLPRLSSLPTSSRGSTRRPARGRRRWSCRSPRWASGSSIGCRHRVPIPRWPPLRGLTRRRRPQDPDATGFRHPPAVRYALASRRASARPDRNPYRGGRPIDAHMTLAGRRILVTGGSGTIGARLVERLLELGRGRRPRLRPGRDEAVLPAAAASRAGATCASSSATSATATA